MRAVWYDEQGPAHDVLVVGEQPDPVPATGEVCVRVHLSGVNPGDTKKRAGWLGSTMPYPRVIPHSDAAGVIESVGDGVDRSRVGRRVWVFGAQSYRPFGTAADRTVVPSSLALDLPDGVSDEIGACMGIPGITAHRAVFTDGPVDGTAVLVHGVLGGVGMLAAQLARWAGATVIGTVRRSADLELVDDSWADHVVALDHADPADAIRAHAPAGVDRVIEVDFSDNVDLDATVVKAGATIATYATRDHRPGLLVLADAVRQRDDPPARKRRLPAGGQAAGSERPDGSEPSGRSGGPRRRADAARTDGGRSRTCRRRCSRADPRQPGRLTQSHSTSVWTMASKVPARKGRWRALALTHHARSSSPSWRPRARATARPSIRLLLLTGDHPWTSAVSPCPTSAALRGRRRTRCPRDQPSG